MSLAWRCLFALTLARVAMAFQFQAVAAVAPLMAGGLGLDKTQLGWLIGLYLLPGVAFALPGGLLGRRFGDKRLVLVGLALMAAGGATLALARTLLEAEIARFVCGIGAVMLNVLMTKMATDLFEGRERLLAMSVLINAWPIVRSKIQTAQLFYAWVVCRNKKNVIVPCIFVPRFVTTSITFRQRTGP